MPPSSRGETPPAHSVAESVTRPRCRRCASSGVAPGAAPRDIFCCSGCALSVRVPRDAEGNFPANAALGVALAVALLLFNQLLLASLVWLTPGSSPRGTTASLACGALLLLCLAGTQWRVGVRRSTECIVIGAVGVVWTLAVARFSESLGLLATSMYLLWAIRGWIRPPRPPEHVL